MRRDEMDFYHERDRKCLQAFGTGLHESQQVVSDYIRDHDSYLTLFHRSHKSFPLLKASEIHKMVRTNKEVGKMLGCKSYGSSLKHPINEDEDLERIIVEVMIPYCKWRDLNVRDGYLIKE